MNIKRNNGRFVQCAERIERECLYCHNRFWIKESQLKYGRGKYCSRECCDEHKKSIRVGRGNGAFGRKMSTTEKQMRSDITTQSWKTPKIKQNRLDGLAKYVKTHGHYPGDDPISMSKRQKTLREKYGVEHIWELKESRQKCEKTCLERYGKNSWQIAYEALQRYSTEIEEKTKSILEKNGIKFESQYVLSSDQGRKIYDFYVPSSKTLIEVDGNFWHGNPMIFPKETLLEVQELNQMNDAVKTTLAERLGFKLLRFWEHEVKDDGFEKRLLSAL